MIRTLKTICCPVHQEYEKDMSLGPPETGSTEQPGEVHGDKAEHGQAEGSELSAGNTRDKAVEPGMPGLDKLSKKKTQQSRAWLKIKTVSAAGDRAGLPAAPGALCNDGSVLAAALPWAYTRMTWPQRGQFAAASVCSESCIDRVLHVHENICGSGLLSITRGEILAVKKVH